MIFHTPVIPCCLLSRSVIVSCGYIGIGVWLARSNYAQGYHERVTGNRYERIGTYQSLLETVVCSAHMQLLFSYYR